MPESAYTRYLQLVKKVDQVHQRVLMRFSREIACRPGCSDCCRVPLTIFPIEAHHLRTGFQRLPHSTQKAIAAKIEETLHMRKRKQCALLDEDRCLLHAYRPLLCKTHGLPILLPGKGNRSPSSLAYCHLNFQGIADPSTIPQGLILNLELMNRLLVAINALYLKERGLRPHALRVPIGLSLLEELSGRRYASQGLSHPHVA
ncbi:MAG: YkgJ family cysteine cluster protein [Nitrospirae bacterium]|nr:YkgJ family cysteine cluster protein [Nitrospirota bacterium]